MLDPYTGLKFIHVAGAMAWFGGALVLTALHVRYARELATGSAAAARTSDAVAAAVIRPGMIVTVLAGIAMTLMRGGMQAWERWGVVVSMASLMLTLLFVRRYRGELARLLDEEAGDAVRTMVVTRRLAKLGALNVLLLLTAVWAMVYKPVI